MNQPSYTPLDHWEAWANRPQPAQQEPVALRGAIVVNLVREGITKHRARELADHFIGLAAPQSTQQEPVAWVSVKDALPKAVLGLSYKKSITDTVLVRHSDRPDYPITAHAVLGEGLGAGISILTKGASEYPEIAWYSASSDLKNPFGLRRDDYERYLPRIFGSKITHWMPITTPPQRKPLTSEQIEKLCPQFEDPMRREMWIIGFKAAHNIKD